mmetsp:Transcript_19424/g.29846  ORF Transcript_19424/g.29846 Transcript_19424/m.29846 type:complete len:642 (-) Transcript_19424:6-1931(-)
MEEKKEQTQQKQKKQHVMVDYSKKYKRAECEDLLKRKFFYTQSFEIYGGVAGFYDFGPLGSAVKANIEQQWKNHFILEDDMLELTCTCMTVSDVLKTSGHVEKFADFMVKDTKNGQCHRADKLIDDHITKVLTKKKNMPAEEKDKLLKIQQDCENYNAEQLNACIKDNKIKAPDTSNELSEAVPFNLMFASEIGPTGQMQGFLRPETSQGIFLNFRRLNEFNNGRMPFAAAQMGLGFRNEIHPRQGLLRVREFQMAEIEHFVDPENKDHVKFANVADLKLPLWSACSQGELGPVTSDLTIKEAVDQKLIANETLAYYMGRTYLFLVSMGINAAGIRFRQHRDNEMAHYAKDCWDAEVETSYGWIEVVGHADRSAFDLTRHSNKTKVDLVAARPLKEPKTIHFVHVALDKAKVGKSLKKDSKPVVAFLDALDDEGKEKLMVEFEANGEVKIPAGDKEVVLTSDLIKFERQQKTVMEEKYVPSVIEPAFGIGRIIYCVFEHCFKVRENDAQRTYFTFPPLVAPMKCVLLALVSNPELNGKVQQLKSALTRVGLSSKIDDSSNTVGKKYARTDECGIPYAFTVDFDTLTDNTVTMRDLETTNQIRLPLTDAPALLQNLVNGFSTWEEAVTKYGLVQAKEEEKKE